MVWKGFFDQTLTWWKPNQQLQEIFVRVCAKEASVQGSHTLTSSDHEWLNATFNNEEDQMAFNESFGQKGFCWLVLITLRHKQNRRQWGSDRRSIPFKFKFKMKSSTGYTKWLVAKVWRWHVSKWVTTNNHPFTHRGVCVCVCVGVWCLPRGGGLRTDSAL